MKLQTNKRPYNTIGYVHHITMDEFDFAYLRSSIKSTTALTNFIDDIDNFKCDAFTDKKFVVIITPDDCEKPDHKMSFLFFGKIDPKYVKYIENRASRWWESDQLPKSPVACVYCANTDRFRRIKRLIIIPEAMEKEFLAKGDQDGLRESFLFSKDINFRFGSHAERELLTSITKEGK